MLERRERQVRRRLYADRLLRMERRRWHRLPRAAVRLLLSLFRGPAAASIMTGIPEAIYALMGIPAPPKPLADMKEFEYPYCMRVHPATVAEPVQWK
jgi:hypothetical protein